MAAVLIVQRYFFQQKLTDQVALNEGVALTKEFSVKSTTENQNSSVKGTILVWGDKDKGIADHMRITASYEIDPEDFAGLTFYIPKKWYISNLLSSTPEGQETDLKPRAFERDSVIDEWRNRVEIGFNPSFKPVGGGTGTVMFDLVADRKAILPEETFNLLVTIGSDMKYGVRSVGVGFIKIPISVKAE
ncbi:hypothetical protein [Cohnella cellulosilytica]|uniref:Uncharacterized protein n=1 Tax=Cohnella cellulosilytica TaxID=986710 RepID=A0ABW2FD62_9BACL